VKLEVSRVGRLSVFVIIKLCIDIESLKCVDVGVMGFQPFKLGLTGFNWDFIELVQE